MELDECAVLLHLLFQVQTQEVPKAWGWSHGALRVCMGLLLAPGAHPHPWSQPCVCCWVLSSLCSEELERTSLDQVGHSLWVVSGIPGTASGIFRTPVSISGSYFLPIIWTFPAARWEELSLWRAMSGMHWSAPLSELLSHIGSIFLSEMWSQHLPWVECRKTKFFAGMVWSSFLLWAFPSLSLSPSELSYLSTFWLISQIFILPMSWVELPSHCMMKKHA